MDSQIYNSIPTDQPPARSPATVVICILLYFGLDTLPKSQFILSWVRSITKDFERILIWKASDLLRQGHSGSSQPALRVRKSSTNRRFVSFIDLTWPLSCDLTARSPRHLEMNVDPNMFSRLESPIMGARYLSGEILSYCHLSFVMIWVCISCSGLCPFL